MCLEVQARQKIISFLDEHPHVKKLIIFTDYFFLAFFYKSFLCSASIQLFRLFVPQYLEHFMEIKLEKEKLKIISKFDCF